MRPATSRHKSASSPGRPDGCPSCVDTGSPASVPAEGAGTPIRLAGLAEPGNRNGSVCWEAGRAERSAGRERWVGVLAWRAEPPEEDVAGAWPPGWGAAGTPEGGEVRDRFVNTTDYLFMHSKCRNHSAAGVWLCDTRRRHRACEGSCDGPKGGGCLVPYPVPNCAAPDVLVGPQRGRVIFSPSPDHTLHMRGQ